MLPAESRSGLDRASVFCDDLKVHGIVAVFIFTGVLVVAMGPVGYLISRRGGPDEVRRFLLWYVFVWPFAAVGLSALLFPKLHWLYFMEFAIVAGGYAVQILDFRRRRAKRRVERGRMHIEL